MNHRINNMKENIKKIIILDYSTGEVIIKDYDENIWDCAEDMTDENGNLLLHSDCHYMIVNKLNLKID